MPIDKFDKHTDVFVETGSYLGEGIQLALTAGFKKIHSIEIVKAKYDICKDLFKGEKKVKLYLGDSVDLLEEIISKIKEPITFWLDGHFSEGDRKHGTPMKTLCPLMDELEIIKKHPIKNHVIMIDDMNCWKGMSNIYHEGFDTETIKRKLLEINPEYKLNFINGTYTNGKVIPKDILIAWAG